MRRNWIKLYVDQCLRGTMISELSAVQRWIWVGLLLMAGDSSEEGLIFLRKDESGAYVGYSDPTIAELLGVEVDDFLNATAKMIRYEKISVDKNGVIKILNWKKYQSEYQRQKPYRSEGQDFLRKEGDKKNSNLPCNSSNALEEDRDLDLDKDLDKENRYILKFLSEVKNYPYDEKRDLGFIKGLIADFPDLDALEEIKKKCAWWLSNPILKNSNPHLQLRNWFLKARQFLKEGDKSRDVGKSYMKEDEFLPMKLLNRIYEIRKGEGGDIAEFYYKARLAFPKIKAQWEKSDKRPETFIKFVQECDKCNKNVK